MAKGDVYGTSAAAAILGVHRNSVWNAIRAGKLRARSLPRSAGSSSSRFEIRRDELARYMLGLGEPPAVVRRLFSSAEAVALVRTPAAVQAALGRLMPTIQCDSLFDLGRLVEGRKIWAAVLDLRELGTAHTARELRGFYPQLDRPELIALVPDDGVASLPSPVPFDVPIGAGTSPAAIAGAVVRLRAAARA